MINSDFAKYCFEQIDEIFRSDEFSTRKKILAAYKVFKDFFIKFDEKNDELFTNFYQRIVYILKKHDIDKNTAKRIHFIRYFAIKLQRNKNKTVSEDDCYIFFANLFIILTVLSHYKFKNYPQLLQKYTGINLIGIDLAKPDFKEYLSSEKVFVISIISTEIDLATLEIELENGKIAKLLLKKPWNLLANYLEPHTALQLVNVSIDGDLLSTNKYSLIVYEPDFLVDVTDIAECFVKDDFFPHLYFVNKFTGVLANLAMLRGNIINQIFDEIILDENRNYDKCFTNALINKPLQTIAASSSIENLKLLYVEINTVFEKLQQCVKKLNFEKAYIEPAYISPKYGLSGRLDLLGKQGNELHVIELKSGSAPTNNLLFVDFDKTYNIRVWKNNIAQAVAYLMLLENQTKNNKIFASILYASALQDPLRNVPNVLLTKQQIIRCRNGIAILLKRLTKNPQKWLEQFFTNSDISFKLPTYKKDDYNNLKNLYHLASETEKHLIAEQFSFVAKLNFQNKIGDEINSVSMASLWLDQIEDKIEKGTVLTDLILDENKSDFAKMHLTFRIKKETARSSTIRKGDMCLLYCQSNDANFVDGNTQILRGLISKYSDDEITLNLRNKMINYDLPKNVSWIIEQEQSDTITNYLYASIFSLLKVAPDRRQILLGLSKPEPNNDLQIKYEELTEEQNTLLSKVISARHYFLLQGPPGAGKTSFMLRYLVKYYFENTKSNILLVAYTNRAADEICLALERILPKIDYLRLGNKESTEIVQHSIAHLASQIRFLELYNRISNCRVFVSTIASLLTSNEIFQIKQFDIAIVDEASQILESYIYNLITKVQKFILIGDEKQLPAVVPLKRNQLSIKNDVLQKIKLTDLGISYFERMLKIAQENHWTENFGMLQYQARMQKPIMDLANYLFYSNKLQLASYIKPNNFHIFTNGKYKFLNDDNIIFIDTPISMQSKQNPIEARLAADIAKTIASSLPGNLNNKNIGIITAFRMQGNEIFKNLGEYVNFIDVDTVERFQGSERDVIIISFAVNKLYDIELISNISLQNNVLIDRKLNVALTRAKEKLIILGNANILQASPVYFRMINYIKEKHLFMKYEDILY